LLIRGVLDSDWQVWAINWMTMSRSVLKDCLESRMGRLIEVVCLEDLRRGAHLGDRPPEKSSSRVPKTWCGRAETKCWSLAAALGMWFKVPRGRRRKLAGDGCNARARPDMLHHAYFYPRPCRVQGLKCRAGTHGRWVHEEAGERWIEQDCLVPTAQ